jgi:hypothetical protein
MVLQLIPVLIILAGFVAVLNPVDLIEEQNLEATVNLHGLVPFLWMDFYNMH